MRILFLICLLFSLLQTSICRATEADNTSVLKQQLQEHLSALRRAGVRPDIFPKGTTAESYQCRSYDITQTAEIYAKLGQKKQSEQWYALYAWMLETDIECESRDDYYSQADEAWKIYDRIGWKVAARRAARKYARWILGEQLGEAYSDLVSDEEILGWFQKAGTGAKELAGVRAKLEAAEAKRAQADQENLKYLRKQRRGH